MAVEIPGKTVGFESAAADLSTHQFKAVIFSSTGVALTGAGGKCDGVLQNKPVAGAAAHVMVDGVSKVVAGAALAKGALVSVTAAGKLKAAATGEFILGTLLEASTADNDIVTVLIARQGRSA